MKSDKLFRFGIIVGTLIVMNIFKGWFFYNIFMSIFSIAIGEDNLAAQLLSVFVCTVLVGVLTMLPIYWSLRENAEERRRFLSYFAEHDYNSDNLRTYLQETGIVRQDRTVFVIALLAVLIYQYGMAILQYPLYLIDFVLEFVIIFGISLLFDRFVRRALYDKWERERLHK